MDLAAATSATKDAGADAPERPRWCGGRLQGDSSVLPEWLATMLDGHAWPSASPYAALPWSRTVCEHVDYEGAWRDHRALFTEQPRTGAPAPSALWEAKRALAKSGTALLLDVQVELVDGRLALAIYGAGVRGWLDDVAWKRVAGLLTTCCSMLHEPHEDVVPFDLLPSMKRPSSSGKRALPTPVRPLSRESGYGSYTWWGYPVHGTPEAGCSCAAHEVA